MKIVFATRMGNTDELVRQKLGYTDAIQIVVAKTIFIFISPFVR